MQPTTLDDVLRFVAELDEQYQREQRQAIMQRNMDKATMALAGQEACERLRRWLEMRSTTHANFTEFTQRRKRA